MNQDNQRTLKSMVIPKTTYLYYNKENPFWNTKVCFSVNNDCGVIGHINANSDKKFSMGSGVVDDRMHCGIISFILDLIYLYTTKHDAYVKCKERFYKQYLPQVGKQERNVRYIVNQEGESGKQKQWLRATCSVPGMDFDITIYPNRRNNRFESVHDLDVRITSDDVRVINSIYGNSVTGRYFDDLVEDRNKLTKSIKFITTLRFRKNTDYIAQHQALVFALSLLDNIMLKRVKSGKMEYHR